MAAMHRLRNDVHMAGVMRPGMGCRMAVAISGRKPVSAGIAGCPKDRQASDGDGKDDRKVAHGNLFVDGLLVELKPSLRSVLATVLARIRYRKSI